MQETHALLNVEMQSLLRCIFGCKLVEALSQTTPVEPLSYLVKSMVGEE